MLLIALMLLFLAACTGNQTNGETPPTGTSPATSEFTAPTQSAFTSTQIEITKVPATEVPALGATLVDSFPLTPGSMLEQGSLSEPETGDPQGYFTLIAQGTTVQQLADFYNDELPKGDWMLRYSDHNFLGGLTQYWKQGNTYLTLQMGYVDNQLVVNASYQRIPQDAAKNLPAGFNLPDGAELVSASGTSWTYYVTQDFSQVTASLDQQFSALGWQPGFPLGGFGGECGGECSGSSSYPAGVLPLPSPTPDPRLPENYAYILPNGDEFYLEASPHQQATILVIDMSFKQAAVAGLPADVTIYPGSAVQSATPGVLLYQSQASPETIRQYYVDQLCASGWQLEGQPQEGGGLFMAGWIREDLSINITITADGVGGSLVSISCEGCK